LLCSTALSQIAAISGKVNDAVTRLPIAGVSVKIAGSGTSTNKNGEFNLVIEQSIVRQYGIVISCIGYQQKHTPFKPDGHYDITLQQATGALKEITIQANGENIVQKAIRKIPQNYPVKDFMMEGFLRVYHIANDTAGYYKYYKNDAVIRLYYPSYLEKYKMPRVALIENQPLTRRNLKSDKDTVRWVNSYLAVPISDVVHSQTGVLDAKRNGKYTFVINGKESVNGSRVYVVNYFSAEKNDETGVLCIDTASYAFVKIEITRYNVKHFPFVKLNKTSRTINYKKIKDRWFLDNLKANISTTHSKVDLSSSVDFKTIAIDTVNAQPISYHDEIQNMSEDSKINNSGSADTRAKYADYFKNADADTSLAHIAAPFVDTGKPKKRILHDPLNMLVGYLRGDNFRYVLTIGQLPVSIAQNQPVLNGTIGSIANYSFGFNAQFRLYKELFFETEDEFNYGIGGIANQTKNSLLTYNFILNKNYHPIMLAPSFGYASLTLSKSNVDYYKQTSLISGLSFAYEINRHWNYYIAGKYYSILSTANLGLNLSRQQATLAAGFIYKFK